MTINTSRLIIQPINENNLKDILRCIDVSINTPIPKNASNYQIKKFLAFNNKIKKFNSLGYFAIILKHNFKPIGLLSIILRYLNESLINELGYLITKEYRNNGFASEVIFNSLKFIFTQTNIDRIYSLIEKDNYISKHILENKMKFNFVNSILDTNTLKYVYTLDKNKFINKFNSYNMINQF